MKQTESSAISRRQFAMGGVSAGAAMLAPGASFAQVVPPLSGTQSTVHPMIKAGANTSFASLKQIDAGLVNVGYAEDGPADGPPVILLQGWPYDIYSYVDVAPLLSAKGYRVIIPYLRGYGSTRFLSNETLRNGQPYVVALTSSISWTLLISRRRSSPVLIGEVGPRISWRFSGRSVARRSSQ